MVLMGGGGGGVVQIRVCLGERKMKCVFGVKSYPAKDNFLRRNGPAMVF